MQQWVWGNDKLVSTQTGYNYFTHELTNAG